MKNFREDLPGWCDVARSAGRRFLGVLACALVLCSAPAFAGWQAQLPDSRLMGSAEFSVFGFRVYSASLWGTSAVLDYQHPFALELTYRRSISRAQLVEASVDEMRRLQGERLDENRLSKWQAEMHKAFVDVEPGRRITGVYRPDFGASFYVDERLHYQVADLAFARAFFDIWLDPRTRSPQLRQRLLGGQ